MKEKVIALKEKFIELFGTAGLIIFYVIATAIVNLPFIMIGTSVLDEDTAFIFFILLMLLFNVIAYFIRLSSPVFWCWGLICVVNGPFDIFAIIYFVAFTIYAIYYMPIYILWTTHFIIALCNAFKKDHDKGQALKNTHGNKTAVNNAPEKEISQKTTTYNPKPGIFYILREAMNCGPILSPIDKLSLATVLCWQEFKDEVHPKHLSSNDLTKCDMVLFTAFVTRAYLLVNLKREDAKVFEAQFVKQVYLGADMLFSDSLNFSEIFNNRMPFFDRVLTKAEGFEALQQEIELILKRDIIYEGVYTPYSENTPLVLADFALDMECSMETNLFTNQFIPQLIDKHASNIINYFAKK